MQPKTPKTNFPSKVDFNSRFKPKGTINTETNKLSEVQLHAINQGQIQKKMETLQPLFRRPHTNTNPSKFNPWDQIDNHCF